jgi:hypothetical protein
MNHYGKSVHRRKFGRLLREEVPEGRRGRTFGEPLYDRSEAAAFCEAVWEHEVSSRQQILDDEVEERLQALGYTEDEIG